MQLVASMIRLTLADQDKMEQLTGLKLTASNKESLTMMSECAYYLLTATNFGLYYLLNSNYWSNYFYRSM